IEQLTRESPGHQVRICTLRQSISQRLDQIGRLVAADGNLDSDELDRLAEHFPVQAPSADMMAAERTALAGRSAVVYHTRRQANWLAIGSLAAQILLLFGLATLAVRDSGRRSRAEAASQRAHSRAGAVLDTVREPIVLLDAQLRMVMYNAAFAELFGIDGD